LARDRETWFKERTYHHQDFADIGRLVEMKQRQGLKEALERKESSLWEVD